MRVRARDTHFNGVRTRKYGYATRQHKRSRNISAWLQRMYSMHVSPFCLKMSVAKSLVETPHWGIDCSTIRIELWRARIRTGSYQVNGPTLAACILIKEAHFFNCNRNDVSIV
jgi:hypothetical protein